MIMVEGIKTTVTRTILFFFGPILYFILNIFLFYLYRIVINKKFAIWATLAALVVLALVLGLVFGLKGSNDTLIVGAVVSNGRGCAEIGR